MVRQFVKTLPLQLTLGLLVLVGVWVLHTYLLAGPNEGFNPSGGSLKYWLLSQILALSGRVASGTVFWFVFCALGSAVISGFIRYKRAFFSGLAKVPTRVGRGLAGGTPALAGALGGASLGILVFGGLSNRVGALVAAGLAVLAIAEGEQGLYALLTRCVYNDARRALSKPPRRLAVERYDGFVAGFLFGCLMYAVLLLLPDFLLLGLGVISAVVAVVLAAQGTQAGAGTAAGMLLALAVVWARVSVADDGGFAEATGPWITSPGAAQAIMMGLPPAMAAALGAIIGALGPTLGGMFVAGVMPVLTAPPTGAAAVPQPSPAPVAHPDIEWTDPRGVTNVLQWSEEHNGYINVLTGGFVDPADVEGWKQNVVQTQQQVDAWRTHNQELEAAGLDSQSQALSAIEAAHQADLAVQAAAAKEWRQWYRDWAETQRDNAEKLVKVYGAQANLWANMTSAAEWTQAGADVSINVLATVTGPVGKSIKTAYTVAKDVGKHTSASYAKGESMLKGVGKGFMEAGFDVGFDKLKGTKFVQKIPGFGKLPGGKFSGESLGTIEKAISQQLGRDFGSWAKQDMIRNAFRDGFKAAAKSHGQKLIVKDPAKTWLGLK